MFKSTLRKLFNTNTGYFLKSVLYFYNGNAEIGFILCKGFILFGISGYDRINYFVDKKDAEKELNFFKGLEFSN